MELAMNILYVFTILYLQCYSKIKIITVPKKTNMSDNGTSNQEIERILK